MRGRVEQHLMLVLAVQIDERAAESRSAALVASAPSTNARLRPCAETSRRTISSRAVRRVEDRLDGRAVLARTHQLGARASADEQSDRSHQNRLAGAGFPGQDSETGLEFQLQAVDDGQVPDAEEAQQGVCSVSP